MKIFCKIILLIFSEEEASYILPRYLVQDIDTLDDWIRGKAMYKVLSVTGVPA